MATSDNTTAPRVYVGTYAKYNNGSIKGDWLDLEDYTGSGEFYAACAALHADESDPEYMFQDFEGIPEGMIGESHISDEIWNWIALDDDDRELLTVYREHVDQEGDIDTARDAYMGRADTEADWAAEFVEDTGMLQGVPDTIARYFDFEAYARDARLGGDITFARHDGELWVFHNC